MERKQTRKIVTTGLLAAIACLLGATHWGFIPWIGGVSLTILQIPAIIAAVLEGPLSGAIVGLIFGIFSMIQAAVAPSGPTDVWFTNPLLAILPRLCIGPAAWVIYQLLKRWKAVGALAAGAVGSLTNTGLVLLVIGLLGYLPWEVLGGIVVANGLPEMIASALITLAVVGAYWQIPSKKKGSDLEDKKSGS
ncbi:MAG: ECF transporter S component [Chloroflexi bacterium]|nr:ECF transporter S component [Chloroflexota bacterium]